MRRVGTETNRSDGVPRRDGAVDAFSGRAATVGG
jgi:hypothetical protein